ncbi:MAG TPA: hypothetical protein VM529_09630, partial [Gemmata sp.]|nr:hypothetical protein [Gemmata sp.]
MTEPIAVDVPAKPATPAAAPPKVELPKPTAKPAEPSKPPFPRPPAPAATGPGLLERLGRNKAGVGAAALFSLAAGIAGVRLIAPADDDATPEVAAKQPAGTELPPRPTVVPETTPPETITPPGVPVAPAATEPKAPPAITLEPPAPDPAVPAVPATPSATL